MDLNFKGGCPLIYYIICIIRTAILINSNLIDFLDVFITYEFKNYSYLYVHVSNNICNINLVVSRMYIKQLYMSKSEDWR